MFPLVYFWSRYLHKKYMYRAKTTSSITNLSNCVLFLQLWLINSNKKSLFTWLVVQQWVKAGRRGGRLLGRRFSFTVADWWQFGVKLRAQAFFLSAMLWIVCAVVGSKVRSFPMSTTRCPSSNLIDNYNFVSSVTLFHLLFVTMDGSGAHGMLSAYCSGAKLNLELVAK